MMNYTSAVLIKFCLNATIETNHEEVWSLNNQKTSGIVAATFVLLFIVLGLPWNIVVLVTAIKERLYHQPTIILLINLVVSDLILIILILPFEVVVGIAGEYIFGSNDAEKCQSCFMGLGNISCSLASVFTISMMSFDRFIFIYKPLRYNKIITPLRTLIAVFLAWVVTVIVTILPIFGVGNLNFFPPLLSCIVDYSSLEEGYFAILLVMVCVPLLICIVCNVLVIFIAIKNINAIYKVHNCLQEDLQKKINDNIREIRRNKVLHLFRVFGGLLISNAISWLPMIILILYSLIKNDLMAVPASFITFTHIMYCSQVFLHPMIETAFIKEVRVPARKMLFCGCKHVMDGCSSNHDDFYKSGTEAENGPPVSPLCFSSVDDDDHSPCMSDMLLFWNVCNAAMLNDNLEVSTGSDKDSRKPPNSRISSIQKISSELTIIAEI